MSTVDAIEMIPRDLEEGVSGADTGGVEPPLSMEHTTEDLLKRAGEINSSGKFIFACFSEMHTFLLLRSQDTIFKLQTRLHDSIQGEGTWTDADTENLRREVKEYRASQPMARR